MRVTTSRQGRFLQSNTAMVPPEDEPERFLHVENADRLFVAVAHRNPSAPTAGDRATLAPWSFAKGLQALDDSNSRP